MKQTSMPLIAAHKLVKAFPPARERALDGLSIDINSGSYTAIMGPSGSGKSTLLYALSGMDLADSGSVSFLGSELMGMKESRLASFRRDHMGFVFQNAGLLKHLSLMDNVLLPHWHSGSLSRRELAERAQVLFEKTGIAGLEKRMMQEVSGGELQRAGICRALVGKPDILFCDEPTGALNSKSALSCMALLRGVHREGTAILLVTHDPAIAAWAERIVFMQDGRVVDERMMGPLPDVCEDSKGEHEGLLEERRRNLLGVLQTLGI